MQYRSDIDGLRSIAVTIVVLFHAKLTLFSGGFVGVDVFFIISGYLIGSILLREITQKGRIDLVNFWARRTRRLMPAAGLVIVVTLLFAWLLLPAIGLRFAFSDAFFAITYLTNWHSMAQSVSYFDDGSGVSLFIHFWSLAVEEQFYIFVMIIFAAATALHRFVGWRHETSIALMFCVSVLVSFGFSIFESYRSQPVGFFATHTRIWELGVGVLLAVLEKRVTHISNRVRAVLVWSGAVLLLASIFGLTGEMTYPGYLALLPTIGTALFIAGGFDAVNDVSILQRILSTRPFIWLGQLSYSIYLWHWPVFRFYEHSVERWQPIDMAISIALVVVLSWLTYIFVEKPVRFSKWLGTRPVTSILTLMAPALLAVCFVLFFSTDQSTVVRLAPSQEAVGAESVRKDRPATYKAGCHTPQKDAAPKDCPYGDPNGDKTIVLFGDSHAAQWFPALEPFAVANGYRLVSRTKSACIPTDVPTYNKSFKRIYHECAEWRENVLRELAEDNADIIVLAYSSAHRPYDKTGTIELTGDERLQSLQEAERRTLSQLSEVGGKVVVLNDTPWLPENPINCLVNAKFETKKCRWDLATSQKSASSPFLPSNVLQEMDVSVVSMNDLICPDGVCMATRNDLVVMLDTHHITNTFAQYLSQAMSLRVLQSEP